MHKKIDKYLDLSIWFFGYQVDILSRFENIYLLKREIFLKMIKNDKELFKIFFSKSIEYNFGKHHINYILKLINRAVCWIVTIELHTMAVYYHK